MKLKGCGMTATKVRNSVIRLIATKADCDEYYEILKAASESV